MCATVYVELVRGLGADRVIDYTAEDFTKDEQTYDVVLDAVGKSSSTVAGGCWCRAGSTFRRTWASSPRTRSWRLSRRCSSKVLFPIPPKYGQARVEGFKAMMESGEFKPVIDRRYPLDQIVGAYQVRQDRPEDRQRRDQRRRCDRVVGREFQVPKLRVDDAMVNIVRHHSKLTMVFISLLLLGGGLWIEVRTGGILADELLGRLRDQAGGCANVLLRCEQLQRLRRHCADGHRTIAELRIGYRRHRPRGRGGLVHGPAILRSDLGRGRRELSCPVVINGDAAPTYGSFVSAGMSCTPS